MVRRLDVQIQTGVLVEKLVIQRREYSNIQAVSAAYGQKKSFLVTLQFHGFLPERHPSFRNSDKVCAFGGEFYVFMSFVAYHKRKSQLVFKGSETMADCRL